MYSVSFFSGEISSQSRHTETSISGLVINRRKSLVAAIRRLYVCVRDQTGREIQLRSDYVAVTSRRAGARDMTSAKSRLPCNITSPFVFQLLHSFVTRQHVLLWLGPAVIWPGMRAALCRMTDSQCIDLRA